MKRLKIAALKAGVMVVALAVMGCPTDTGGGGSTTPSLSIVPTAFNFGSNRTQDSFAISNAGSGILAWSISGIASWITISPTAGSTPVTGPTIVNITVNRAGLAPGTYTDEVRVSSNGGSRTISITMKVDSAPVGPTLAVAPASLNFGTTTLTQNLEVQNLGQGTVNWTLTENIPWLTASLLAGSSTAISPTSVVITVNRTGLAPGEYTDNLQFDSDGGNVTVPVTMQVPGPTPLLNVNPSALDFLTNLTELQFTIRNTGTGTLTWNITETLPWLTLNTTSGTTTSENDIITATVNRTGLAPNTYTGTIAIASNGGAANVSVQMVVAPAQLIVIPTTLNFGKFATNKLLTISNGGVGTINWSINTGGFPAWLSLAPSSGDVTAETDGVVVAVDRTGLAPGNYTHTFTVASDAGNVDVTVNMQVAEVPVLTINTGFVNSNSNPLAPLGSQATTFQFTITNTGSGTLNWNISPGSFPGWLSMAPVAGTATGAQVNTVTITVSRAGLLPGGYSANIPVTSNGGNKTLEVTMQVPLRPIIGVIPENLDFGINADTGSIFVANIGDAGTVLNFLVLTDRDWLFVSPATGTSVGTASVTKDYKTVNVSIDRSQLESTGATGTITVYAIDGQGNINPDIAPRTVTVSVQAAELSFQTPLVRVRIPSMLRWAFVMRDIRDASFVVAPELLMESFRIFEDGVVIEEPSETTQQVYLQNSTITAPFSDKRMDLRTKVVLLLDYSGSMVQSANAAGTDLQTLYEQVGGQFIDDFFGLFQNVERGFSQIAIMEYHDRAATASLIQDFTGDPAVLHAALQGVNITDNGASAMLPAISTASNRLVNHDFPNISFDDADIRAVVLFSDGRLTTPPGEVQDFVDVLAEQRTRVISVGWGLNPNHEPLARLAAGTGGHYYLTKTDANGNPVIANFVDAVTKCNVDLASHTVLSYTSLGEGENVPIRFDASLNDPNDNPDLGLIQGTLDEQNVNLASLVGDILMGQISMRTTGVQAGATEVTLRADYLPRNINKFQFTLTTTEAFSIAIVPNNDGGIIEGWTLTNLGGGTYSLTSPTPADVLPYGAYGDLVRLTFAAVGAVPFTTSLFVNNAIYLADAEPKYFVYPDTIDIDTAPFLAPAVPTPLISPTTIDFGTGTNSATFTIRNIGGTYPYAPATPTVLLLWEVRERPIFVNSVTPDSGSRATTIGVDTAQITVDRTIAPGVYNGAVIVAYGAGTYNSGGEWPIFVRLQVTPPILTTLNTGNLAFGAVSQAGGDVTQTFDIRNTGQSTLDWAIVTAGLPAWIATVAPSSGTTTTETDTVSVTVDPTAVAPGVYNAVLPIISDGGSANIPVSVTITP